MIGTVKSENPPPQLCYIAYSFQSEKCTNRVTLYLLANVVQSLYSTTESGGFTLKDDSRYF